MRDKILKIITCFFLAATFVGVCVGATYLDTSHMNAINVIDVISICAAILFGIFYMAMGYVKKASYFYKAFMIAYVVACAASILTGSTAKEKLSICVAIPLVVSLILVTILATGKNLGRQTTLVLIIALIVCHVTPIIYSAVYYGHTGFDKFIIFEEAARLMLALTACTMAVGKYLDKESRGSM